MPRSESTLERRRFKDVQIVFIYNCGNAIANDHTLEDVKLDPIWETLDAVRSDRVYVWKEAHSWYYDPIAVLSQTEELAEWLAGMK